jgi:hypothetical protein
MIDLEALKAELAEIDARLPHAGEFESVHLGARKRIIAIQVETAECGPLRRGTFHLPVAGRPLTERAAFLQGRTGFELPLIGVEDPFNKLDRDKCRMIAKYCRALRRHPDFDPAQIDWEWLSNSDHPERGWKQCSNCERLLPPTHEYFHADPHARDGLHTICKRCRNQEFKAYYRRRKYVRFQV